MRPGRRGGDHGDDLQMRVECEGSKRLLPQPRAPCSGSACPRGGGGLVWQQAPIRQLESASVSVAICPLRLALGHLLLTTEGPGAVPRHKGTEPGREGQAEFHLAFVYAGPLQLLRLGVARCGKSLSLLLCGTGSKERWLVRRPVPFHCLSLCPAGESHPSPAAVFFLFPALICESTARAGQLFRIWV